MKPIIKENTTYLKIWSKFVNSMSFEKERTVGANTLAPLSTNEIFKRTYFILQKEISVGFRVAKYR